MPIAVQQGRTLAALVERFGIKGRHLLQLDEIIVPVAIVEDVRASEIKGTGFQDQFFEAGLAGEVSVLRFLGSENFNALPKRVIVRPSPGLSDIVNLVLNTSAISTVLTGPALVSGENRWSPLQPGSPTRVEFGTAPPPVTGTVVASYQVPADENTVIDLEGWRVPRGAELMLQMRTVNQGTNWSPLWDVEAVDR